VTSATYIYFFPVIIFEWAVKEKVSKWKNASWWFLSCSTTRGSGDVQWKRRLILY